MYIGIDFGTAFSQSAAVIDDSAEILLEHLCYGIPSVFCYDGTRSCVGQDALDACQEQNDLMPVRNVKMNMYDDFVFSGIHFSGRDVIQNIYTSILDTADEILDDEYDGLTYDGVVLSVPCEFGDRERRFLTNAVTGLNRSGIRVVGIIKEPVAAAISYYKHIRNIDGNILVFDLGGGTCDVAIVKRNENISEKFQVIDSDGISVGGRDWDQLLFKLCKDYLEIKLKHEISDPSIHKLIYKEVVELKHSLSKKDKATAAIPVDGVTHSFSIGFDEFAEASIPFLVKIRKMVSDINVKKNNIKAVICVGGGSRMKIIQDLLKKEFPEDMIKLYNPEHAIVLGNAIYADYLDKKVHEGGGNNNSLSSDAVVTDKSMYSYGIKITEGKEYIYNIIHRNDAIPCENRAALNANNKGIGIMWIDVYEGYSEDDKTELDGSSRHIGRVAFRNERGYTGKIMIRLSIAEKGLVELYITDENGCSNSYEFDV